jgi:hypothetical protein
MNEPLDELYFKWLYAKVADVKEPRETHTWWNLLRQLYTKEFVWIVPNDDNRVEDGRDLRWEFYTEQNIPDSHPNWSELGCSMLEMLIGLARRMAFEIDGFPEEWFWHLLRVLDIAKYNDDMFKRRPCADHIDKVLDRVIWRTYNHDGKGGLFPLRNPSEDQTKVEIWYQLSAYVLENV